jgi:serine protease Do
MRQFLRAIVLVVATSAALTAQQPAPTPLDAFSHSLESLTSKVKQSVVQIFSTAYAAASDDSDNGSASALITKQRSTGTGVILTADGFIVTNAHVVRGARKIQVRLAPSMITDQPPAGLIDATLVGIDTEADLAVIKIEHKDLTFLHLGDSGAVHQGQLVLAFGNPLGLESSVSMGIISSTARQIKPEDIMVYLQTDAPINPGNSGGPLVDTEGRVIGINTFILSQSGGSEGLGFAIPSSIVTEIYDQIRKDGHVHRGQIGITAETITPLIVRGLHLSTSTGVIVADVRSGSTADKAGIKPGDVIRSIDGRPLANARMFELIVSRRQLSSTVKLGLLRGKDKAVVEVPVHEKPDSPERFADMVDPAHNLIPELGILAIQLDAQLSALLPGLRHDYGVVVAARGATASYEGQGLQPGDVIYELNGTPVVSLEMLKTLLKDVKSGDPLVFQVERSSKLRYVAIELE